MYIGHYKKWETKIDEKNGIPNISLIPNQIEFWFERKWRKDRKTILKVHKNNKKTKQKSCSKFKWQEECEIEIKSRKMYNTRNILQMKVFTDSQFSSHFSDWNFQYWWLTWIRCLFRFRVPKMQCKNIRIVVGCYCCCLQKLFLLIRVVLQQNWLGSLATLPIFRSLYFHWTMMA